MLAVLSLRGVFQRISGGEVGTMVQTRPRRTAVWGMVLAAVSLLDENPTPTEQQVREGLEGNLCRCTGYHNIVKAVLAAAEPDPERGLLERERLGRVHRAILNLSEQQRRCLHLRMEGLRYPEIAEVLGISASTVGEFLRRAIARLRKAIHE